MTMKIYLVEDDAVIAGHVARHLEAWGYQVKTAEDFRNILGEFQAFQPQLVLLDIALPFFNGYHWCTELRKVSRVPIIFLSSVSDNMNIVTAMDLGGDDFVPKPFDLSVLSAKVRSTLRRCYDFAAPQPVLAHRGRSWTRRTPPSAIRGRSWTSAATSSAFCRCCWSRRAAPSPGTP